MKRTIPRLIIGLVASVIGILPLVAATNEAPRERVITADLQQVKGPLNTMFKQCVGAGRANEGLRADWQRQLTYAHRECGFNYIRMHGLFCDDMGVYKEDKAGLPNTTGNTLTSCTIFSRHRHEAVRGIELHAERDGERMAKQFSGGAAM